jgi:hypothetical protein
MAFKNNVQRAAKIMFGDDSERDLPHPLKHCGSDMMHSEGWNKMRQMNSPGTVGNDASYKKAEKMRTTHPVKNNHVRPGSAAYNALSELNMLDKMSKPAPPPLIPGTPTQTKFGGMKLPDVKPPVFGSGSYSNPQSTTDSGANNNSNTINPYSFMDDPMLDAERDPNRNKFGFHKRNKTSLDARIKQAEADGKLAKKARLEKKLENFTKNQEARASGDFLDKINPKNIL